MTEKQYAPSAMEKKVGKKAKATQKVGAPIKQEKVEKKEEVKMEEKKEEEKLEKKEEVKKEKKKVEVKEVKPKEMAFARGSSLRVSSKHCFAICKMIKGKTPESAVEFLEKVVKDKAVVRMPMREVGHKKSRGLKNIAGGRFPKKASLEMINLLKQVNANANVCGVENPVIVIAKADIASRPYRKAGRKTKRTHVYIEVRDKTKLKKKGGK